MTDVQFEALIRRAFLPLLDGFCSTAPMLQCQFSGGAPGNATIVDVFGQLSQTDLDGILATVHEVALSDALAALGRRRDGGRTVRFFPVLAP